MAEQPSKLELCAAAKARGNKAFGEGKFEEAITEYTEAIWHDPTAHALYSNRSGSYASLKRFQAALDDAEQCIAAKGDWSKGYSRKGLALVRLGRLDEAKAAYKAGLALDAGNKALRDGLGEVERWQAVANPFCDGTFKIGPGMWERLTADPKTKHYLDDPAFVAQLKQLETEHYRKEAEEKKNEKKTDGPSSTDAADEAALNRPDMSHGLALMRAQEKHVSDYYKTCVVPCAFDGLMEYLDPHYSAVLGDGRFAGITANPESAISDQSEEEQKRNDDLLEQLAKEHMKTKDFFETYRAKEDIDWLEKGAANQDQNPAQSNDKIVHPEEKVASEDLVEALRQSAVALGGEGLKDREIEVEVFFVPLEDEEMALGRKSSAWRRQCARLGEAQRATIVVEDWMCKATVEVKVKVKVKDSAASDSVSAIDASASLSEKITETRLWLFSPSSNKFCCSWSVV